MPDITLRFNKDMLVISTPLTTSLERQGVDVQRDAEFITLFEPDTLGDVLRLESMAGAACLVANVAHTTPAQLAHQSLEDRMEELAEASLTIAQQLKPQHMLVEIRPCGLPLDGTSKASLNENRDQYARAARVYADRGFDAFFLNGFATCDDLKCALMGVRQVSDMPIIASVDLKDTMLDEEVLADDGVEGFQAELSREVRQERAGEEREHFGEDALAGGRDTLGQALTLMEEYGASVAGFATAKTSSVVQTLAQCALSACNLPVLVQLKVREYNPKQGVPTEENPYFCPDVMMDIALALRAQGVQFLRAAGAATPAYTGALVAAVSGSDVVCAVENENSDNQCNRGEDNAKAAHSQLIEEDQLTAVRAELAAALADMKKK